MRYDLFLVLFLFNFDANRCAFTYAYAIKRPAYWVKARAFHRPDMDKLQQLVVAAKDSSFSVFHSRDQCNIFRKQLAFQKHVIENHLEMMGL